jgi:N-acetylmuramic acid 6-phosphate etherase
VVTLVRNYIVGDRCEPEEGTRLTNRLPTTEQQNPASTRLDEMPVQAILRLMNEEDRRVPEAVADALVQIAAAVDLLVETWRGGGRWIYVGAGTSGRIAAMDAAECAPTFGVPPDRVRTLVAGGEAAATRAVEGAEDDSSAAARDLEALGLTLNDAVVGLTASGRTPYVIAAVRYASEAGCATVGISNSADAELSGVARVSIEVVTGPAVLTGSTRLKAGTAEKLILNMLSTAAFTRLGKVYGNWMVDLRASNEKLKERARRIVCEIVGVPGDEAAALLRAAEGSVKVAIVMGIAEVAAGEARSLLDAAGGSVRRALSTASPDRPA